MIYKKVLIYCEKEIHIIKQITQSNGYQPQMIDKTIGKQKRNKSKQITYQSRG